MTDNIAEVLAAEAEAAEAGRHLPIPAVHRVRAREQSEIFTVRFPADVLNELRKLAGEQHTTPGQLIRGWVVDRLEGRTPAAGVVDLDTVRQAVREEIAAAK